MRNYYVSSVRILCTIIVLCTVACSDPFLLNAREDRIRSEEIETQVANQLRIGMDRSEVESIVNKLAWKHYSCKLVSSSIDIYLFGSHNTEFTGFLWLVFLPTEGGEHLDKIATPENYMLDSYTHECDETLLS